MRGKAPNHKGPVRPVTRGLQGLALMLLEGGLNGGQLRAGPGLLLNTKAGAARPQVGRSRLIINLLSQGCRSFKAVPMVKGTRKVGSSRVRPLGRVSTLLAPWRRSDLGQLCKNVYPSALLIQA